MTIMRMLRSTPEEQGIASAAILKFVERVDRDIHELHSFMLVRHGKVVAEGWWEPYAPEKPHMLFSLSKSFTSTAIGMAVAEGRLSVEDPVLSFFPDETPPRVSKNLAAMRVRDLLTMTTGHAKDATQRTISQKEGNWVKGFLELPVRYRPGTHFVYNSTATYMLSAIIQKLTGMTLLDYLTPRLFEPLGIENPTWETCPKGINVGGWGLVIRTEDIACFGQMYLQHGEWNGRQILSPEWVAQATSRQVPNGDQPPIDWSQGYGYQFWRCRYNIYRGDGAFGQYCIVMPEQDAVLAITSGVRDMQAVLNVVWEELLPAMGTDALPAKPEMHKKLGDRLSCLELKPPGGKNTTPTAGKVTGKTYLFKRNPLGIKDLRMDFGPQHCLFEITGGRGKISLDCGYGKWLPGAGPILEREIQSTLTGGAWITADTFQAVVRLINTPFVQTITCKFLGENLIATMDTNLAITGPVPIRVLEGKMAPHQN